MKVTAFIGLLITAWAKFQVAVPEYNANDGLLFLVSAFCFVYGIADFYVKRSHLISGPCHPFVKNSPKEDIPTHDSWTAGKRRIRRSNYHDEVFGVARLKVGD